jgi:hypothetical protein
LKNIKKNYFTTILSSSNKHGRRGAIQLRVDHAHHARALGWELGEGYNFSIIFVGLFLHGGQRGDLRDLLQKSGHCSVIIN